MALAVPRSKATFRKPRIPFDRLAKELRADIRARAKKLQRDALAKLLGGGMLRAIAAKAPAPEAAKSLKIDPDDLIFQMTRDLAEDFRDFGEILSADLAAHAEDAYNVSGAANRLSLGGKASFSLRNPAILERLAERANMLAGEVEATTFDAIRQTIRVGFWEQREGMDAVARRLTQEFEFLDYRRSLSIARTETLVVTEQATQESFVANGIEKKRWLAFLDSKTRESHREANGQIVAVDEPFIVGGVEMMHPGDPDAPPEEIVNCRCDQVAVIKTTPDPDQLWTGEESPSDTPLAA